MHYPNIYTRICCALFPGLCSDLVISSGAAGNHRGQATHQLSHRLNGFDLYHNKEVTTRAGQYPRVRGAMLLNSAARGSWIVLLPLEELRRRTIRLCQWIDVMYIPILFKVALLPLGQSYDCPNASEVTLNSMGKINHCKTNPNQNNSRNVSIFGGCVIYIYIILFALVCTAW